MAVVGLEEGIRTGRDTERQGERVPDFRGCNAEAASANSRADKRSREEIGVGGCQWLVLRQVAEMLHERGVSFTQQDSDGCTPLHYACLQCSHPLVEFMLGE